MRVLEGPPFRAAQVWGRDLGPVLVGGVAPGVSFWVLLWALVKASAGGGWVPVALMLSWACSPSTGSSSPGTALLGGRWASRVLSPLWWVRFLPLRLGVGPQGARRKELGLTLTKVCPPQM